MTFAYSCFISYTHGQHQLMKRFIDDLQLSLSSSLEPYLREPVYVDDRLVPGYEYNVALARALCQSVAFMVVYTPLYREREYCRRELKAMFELDAQRQLLTQDPMRGSVIPILFRGRTDDLPERIKAHRHFADFSKYTLADSRFRTNRGYVGQIERIAEYIWELGELYTPHAETLFANCQDFRMPAPEPDLNWPPRIPPLFPGRRAA